MKFSSAPLPSVQHTVIRASAGSGKTYRLAHRYIRLLSLGVEPDRILAVTFSRKAAGEIFESIMAYLIAAAGDDEKAAATAEQIERPELGRENFQSLLALFLQNLHRVRVGTLDSFYATILQLFAFELGVAPQSRLMDTGGQDLLQLQTSILDEMSFDRKEEADVLHDLEEAFKLATFGREEQRFRNLFLGFLASYLQAYRTSPDEERWGQVAVIWPDGAPFCWDENLSALAEDLEAAIPGLSEKADHQKYLHQFTEFYRQYRRGDPWGTEAAELVKRFVPWMLGETEAKLGRSVLKLDAARASCVARMMQSLMQGALEHAVAVTRGLHKLVDRYHSRYMEQVCQRGSLSFDDVLQVLAPSGDTPRFSCTPGPDRLFVDFRLDSRIDHWLLDEFQDTSTPQYRVLRNLLDEVFQNSDGSRSVFLVGDVKQSIYGWRGGEFGLMNRILESYCDEIDLQPLDETRRSCRAVLDLVNQTFGALSVDEPGLEEAVTFWSSVWGTHEPAGEAAEFEGYAALLEPDCEGGALKPGLPEQGGLILELLLQVKPWERGLSTVILASSNKELGELASFLREHAPRDVSIRLEGHADPHIEPVYNLLLSLLQWVLHPGDSAAEQHLRMSPLWDDLPEAGHVDARHAALYSDLYELGLYQFFYFHGQSLAARAGLAGGKRWLDLLDFASEFIRDEDADLDEFVLLARSRHLSESASGGSVHLMTVHQSKGLGFDLVFLVLKGANQRSMYKRRKDFLSWTDFGVNEPEWLLARPESCVVDADPVLQAAEHRGQSTEFYEGLCTLYVAATRAKKALYVITGFPGKTATSLGPSNFLKERLCGDRNPINKAAAYTADITCIQLWESGKKDWYRAVEPCELPRKEELRLPDQLSNRLSAVSVPVRRNPSALSASKESAANLFAASVDEGMRFGTAFHDLMESIAWLDPAQRMQGLDADFEDAAREWKSRGAWPEDLAESVIAEAREACSSEAWRQALARPSQAAELWLEAPFEIILDKKGLADEQEWVTGIFDRVVLDRDQAGALLGAHIQDYKTNQGGDDASISDHVAHYRPQMEMYRKVLAAMLQLDASAIRCSLLFSKACRVEPL
jgi:ATP-dependent helicase/nuclease subunit A